MIHLSDKRFLSRATAHAVALVADTPEAMLPLYCTHLPELSGGGGLVARYLDGGHEILVELRAVDPRTRCHAVLEGYTDRAPLAHECPDGTLRISAWQQSRLALRAALLRESLYLWVPLLLWREADGRANFHRLNYLDARLLSKELPALLCKGAWAGMAQCKRKHRARA